MTIQDKRKRWSMIVLRTLVFSLTWWILTDGAADSWSIGVPAIVLAVAVSVALLPPANMVWYELLRFVPFFLVTSLRGGMDVAWRAFYPGIRVDPDLVEYRFRLPPGQSRVFMTNTVSLLPGSLSAELCADCLRVHVLDAGNDIRAELQTVEDIVARIFGTSLNVTADGGINGPV